MGNAELRQSVVLAARFELFTQRFALPSGVLLQPQATIPVGGVPASWTPVENAARVREYWADVLPPGTPERDFPPHWCGAFHLFCIHRAELGLDVFWVRGFAGHLRQISSLELQAGDLAYFAKNQHHAVVEAVDVDAGTFDSIDGNQQPGIKRHAGRKLAAASAFYSLDPLIEAKEGE